MITITPPAEKLSIALPPEIATLVRHAVEAGEYPSSSELIRDALRDWNDKRQRQQGPDELRQLWQQALNDPRPPVAADAVLDRLEHRYQAMIDGGAALRS
ncbi:ribbon-helix-helix domain-containing protein [Verminephrobacter aporrectodeae]|uniref:ribbon-helix-helix domain-containing protein n=1 Tax=Verminephrobacter aporrectodeae TaxID=1110389 RepID=UPI0022443C9B|nr:type II toxin-antitoxin system ParD family antitoxin [Verminephrobacter aporrectodeae]MCW8175023.1 ribbon-helix-helix protein, CopG family [Verminephrobacter aporrectodeae subsp. tuberculatae]MCW8202325.1 ribbon-helix-helix protein, CopG family [Verminephrobacter aporrectodeae subsp. tuberculatae]